MSHLDFELPEIRNMVRNTHKPEEVVEHAVNGDSSLLVVCRECRGRWPCRTVRSLAEWESALPTRLWLSEDPLPQPRIAVCEPVSRPQGLWLVLRTRNYVYGILSGQVMLLAAVWLRGWL